jgi:hemerythrin-like metal-binding protein
MSIEKLNLNIEYNESLMTGIEEIDEQHRFLIDTLHEANHMFSNNYDRELLNQVTKDLLSYAITHFETEEALMQQHGYLDAHPNAAKDHISQHRDFTNRIVSINDRLREGLSIHYVELFEFLEAWLQNHVLGFDQDLGRYLRKSMN